MKLNIKSIIVTALSGVLCLSMLSGCGKDSSEEEDKKDQKSKIDMMEEKNKKDDDSEKEEKEEKEEEEKEEEEEEEETERYALSTYYDNDELEVSLNLFSDYSLYLCDEEEEIEGTYYFEGEYFYMELEGDPSEYEGTVDSEGDLWIEDIDGYFRQVDDMGYSPYNEEENDTTYTAPDFEIPEGGDKYYESAGEDCTRYYDNEGNLAITYPDWMTNYENTLYDGSVLISDSQGGYVFGENISGEYIDYAGEDSDFLTEYFNDDVMYAFEQLYGGDIMGSDITILESENDFDSILTAEGNIYNDQYDINVKISLYWGSSEGELTDTAYVQTIFYEYENEEQYNILYENVYGLNCP